MDVFQMRNMNDSVMVRHGRQMASRIGWGRPWHWAKGGIGFRSLMLRGGSIGRLQPTRAVKAGSKGGKVSPAFHPTLPKSCPRGWRWFGDTIQDHGELQ